MPTRAPRICGCGHRIAPGELCPCQRARKANADKRRPSARKRGYTNTWDIERAAFLVENPKCATLGCANSATVVDHIKPHRGNQCLFWDRSNWQPLCTHCHSSIKQIADRQDRGRSRVLGGKRRTGGGSVSRNFSQKTMPAPGKIRS